MQDICNLANTGTNIALIIAAAFGFIAIASLLLYQLKTGGGFSKGLFSLLLVLGLLGTIVLAPAASYAAGSDAANCPDQTSQSGSSGNSGGNQVSITCPENWIVVPGNSAYNTTDFCLMKYTAKNVGGTITDTNEYTDDDDNVVFTINTYSGGTATSQASGIPWTNISQTDAITAAQTADPGAHLITENEWMTVAHNILANPANWCDPDGSNCGAAPGTAGKILAAGHNDDSSYDVGPLEASTDDSQACFGTVTPGINTPCGSEAGTQKRTLTLSNGEVIWDLVGNVAHWTSGTETQGNLPSSGGSGGPMEYNLDTGMSLPVVDNWGTLAYTNPAVQNPAAANWGVAQQVGVLGSDFDSGSPTVMAFYRGGTWDFGPYSGAFTLGLVGTPSDFYGGLGFRSAL